MYIYTYIHKYIHTYICTQMEIKCSLQISLVTHTYCLHPGQTQTDRAPESLHSLYAAPGPRVELESALLFTWPHSLMGILVRKD
jgi:hypothetical protein